MENNTMGPGPEKAPETKKGKKKWAAFLYGTGELAKILIVAAIIVLPIRYFLFQPFIVKGDSMVPNFHSGDYLIVDEISYKLHSPERGDVVVFRYPLDPTQRYIKRIIGLPGETVDIKSGKITITKGDTVQDIDEKIYLPGVKTEGDVHLALGEKNYFVLGDNRPFSYDSRRWGVLPDENIIGKALFRLYPFTNLSLITHPVY